MDTKWSFFMHWFSQLLVSNRVFDKRHPRVTSSCKWVSKKFENPRQWRVSIGCYKCVKTAQTTTTTVTWIFFSSRHKCRKRNKLILHKESNPKTLNSALKVYHWGTETLSWSKRQQKQQFVNQCSPLRIFNSLQAGRKCFANHATITEQRSVKWCEVPLFLL